MTQGWTAALRDPLPDLSYPEVLAVPGGGSEPRWLSAVRGLAGAERMTAVVLDESA